MKTEQKTMLGVKKALENAHIIIGPNGMCKCGIDENDKEVRCQTILLEVWQSAYSQGAAFKGKSKRQSYQQGYKEGANSILDKIKVWLYNRIRQGNFSLEADLMIGFIEKLKSEYQHSEKEEVG